MADVTVSPVPLLASRRPAERAARGPQPDCVPGPLAGSCGAVVSSWEWPCFFQGLAASLPLVPSHRLAR